jgi:hypothetical protein
VATTAADLEPDRDGSAVLSAGRGGDHSPRRRSSSPAPHACTTGRRQQGVEIARNPVVRLKETDRSRRTRISGTSWWHPWLARRSRARRTSPGATFSAHGDIGACLQIIQLRTGSPRIEAIEILHHVANSVYGPSEYVLRRCRYSTVQFTELIQYQIIEVLTSYSKQLAHAVVGPDRESGHPNLALQALVYVPRDNVRNIERFSLAIASDTLQSRLEYATDRQQNDNRTCDRQPERCPLLGAVQHV